MKLGSANPSGSAFFPVDSSGAQGSFHPHSKWMIRPRLARVFIFGFGRASEALLPGNSLGVRIATTTHPFHTSTSTRIPTQSSTPPYSLFYSFMVLRKPPPPRLENLNKWNARSASPTSPSKSSPSKPRTRLNRAPSEDSIYSPDLNTSPAFDLMPLEEAQRSPVGSPASHPPNPWTESFGDRAKYEYPATQAQSACPTDAEGGGQWIPSPLQAGSHATENGWHQAAQPAPPGHNGSTGEVPVQLQSNNPFLKPQTANVRQNSSDSNDWNDRHSHTTASSDPPSQSMIDLPRPLSSPLACAC